MKPNVLNKIKARRAIRVRARIRGTAERPRLTVSRSNRSVYAQLVDDESGKTLASAVMGGAASEKSGEAKKGGVKKTDAARMAGEAIAKKAVELGIKEAVFDRGSYRYHGRVRAVAEGARSGGLKF